LPLGFVLSSLRAEQVHSWKDYVFQIDLDPMCSCHANIANYIYAKLCKYRPFQ